MPNTNNDYRISIDHSYNHAQAVSIPEATPLHPIPVDEEIHLTKTDLMWTVVSGTSNQTFYQDKEQSKALEQARIIAKKLKVKLILHDAEGGIRDFESFQVNQPRGVKVLGSKS